MGLQEIYEFILSLSVLRNLFAQGPFLPRILLEQLDLKISHRAIWVIAQTKVAIVFLKRTHHKTENKQTKEYNQSIVLLPKTLRLPRRQCNLFLGFRFVTLRLDFELLTKQF
jgi:hypothetical protein